MIVLTDEAATRAFGLRVAHALRVGDVVGLLGPLGAGKTALARGMLGGLGYEGEVPSPSFPIVVPYEVPAVRLPVQHVDLYRIEHEQEVDALALDEALLDGALLIEWPQRLGRRAWREMLGLSLSILNDGTRALTAQVPAAWEARWPLR